MARVAGPRRTWRLDTGLNRLTTFSLNHPWWTISLTIVATLAFAAQFPKITIDTDPKHMLPVTSPVRQHNDQVERDFALHADTIVLGIVNERGIVNRQSLTRILHLTGEIQKIPGVIVRDVVSLSTIDNVAVRAGQLLSFTLAPAILILLREDRIATIARRTAGDKRSFLPRKEEYYDAQSQLARLFTADRIQVFTSGVGDAKKDYPTVVKRTMANVKSGHRTEVTFGSIEYDVGLEDGIFTERALETPPQQWIR